MSTYIITEKQNANSARKGEKIEAESLSSAKACTTRAQMFRGTVLTVEAENGTVLAIKKDGRWTEPTE